MGAWALGEGRAARRRTGPPRVALPAAAEKSPAAVSLAGNRLKLRISLEAGADFAVCLRAVIAMWLCTRSAVVVAS